MAHYGLYVCDTGGSPWDLEFESGRSYTSFGYADPLVSYAQKHLGEGGITAWNNKAYYSFDIRSGVPWDRLRVIAPDPAQRAAPTNVSATPGDTRVTLAWTASAGAASYNVYRATTS